MKEFLTLKDFFLEHKSRYLLGICCLLAADALQLVTPRLLGLFTDTLLVAQPEPLLLRRYILAILAVALGIAVFRYLWRIYIIGASRLLERHLRDRLYTHLQLLSPGFFLKQHTGELMAHLTNDIMAVRTALGLSIVLLIDALFMTVVAFLFMVLTVDVRLTLLALLPMPFLALASQRLGLRVYSHFLEVQDRFGQLTGAAQENISAMRVVQSFALEKVEIARFREASRAYMARNFSLYRYWGFYDPLIYISGLLSFVIVLTYGGSLVIRGIISTGDFVAFTGYLALLTWPMLALGWVVNISQRGRASMQRINRLLKTSSDIRDSPPGRRKREQKLPEKSELQGDLFFRSVSFRYHGQQEPVLDRFSCTIPHRKITAIAGRTGSGKTTLLTLLLRFFDPEAGSIFIGPYNLRELPLKSWRSQIGYVPQDSFVFSTTIADNIAFARPEAENEEIRWAASLAALDEEIERFPRGYQTVVGERGVTLSGGQQQRLALARAVLARPEFLLLDDALSAVDIATEDKILSNLLSGKLHSTLVVVSHRLNVFREADQIIVLDKGRLREEGTHQELFRRKGLYYRLCADQYWEDIMP